MAEICPVCNKKISLLEGEPQPGIYTHPSCEATFLQNPEKYGGKATKKKVKNLWVSKLKKQEDKALYKSVRIKGGLDIKSFDMPFGDMVGFIFKWAMASIPTAIFLAILFAIFTAIFA